jgi:hypothetical protein
MNPMQIRNLHLLRWLGVDLLQSELFISKLVVLPRKRMSVNFPKTASDGSFRVQVQFKGAPNSSLSHVQEWLDAWIAENRDWTFLGKVHHIHDYFSDEPRVELGSKGELHLILCGVSDRKRFWKDWIVRIARSLNTEFPEVGEVSKVEDASA